MLRYVGSICEAIKRDLGIEALTVYENDRREICACDFTPVLTYDYAAAAELLYGTIQIVDASIDDAGNALIEIDGTVTAGPKGTFQTIVRFGPPNETKRQGSFVAPRYELILQFLAERLTPPETALQSTVAEVV